MMPILDHQRALHPHLNRGKVLPDRADVDEQPRLRIDPARIDHVQRVLRPADRIVRVHFQ
jgi:hypothetical protein